MVVDNSPSAIARRKLAKAEAIDRKVDSLIFHLLERRFGIGGYDELAGGTPYYQVAMRQTAIVRKYRRDVYRITYEQAVTVAAWCQRNNKWVPSVKAFFNYVREALEAQRLIDEGIAAARRRDQLNDAIEIEQMPTGDPNWLGTLLRCSDGDIQEVLTRWQKERG